VLRVAYTVTACTLCRARIYSGFCEHDNIDFPLAIVMWFILPSVNDGSDNGEASIKMNRRI
jgi:hypothetical protein